MRKEEDGQEPHPRGVVRVLANQRLELRDKLEEGEDNVSRLGPKEQG